MLSWTMTAHSIAIEKSSSEVRVAGKYLEHTLKVEKQVAASIHSRRRKATQDGSSSVDSSFLPTSDTHRYVKFRASRNSAHAWLETPESVVEAKSRLVISTKVQ